DPRRVLGWVYIGRLVLVCAFLLRADEAASATPERVLAPGILLLITAGYTALALLLSHRRPPTRAFIYAQIVFDASLLTAIVHLTGGQHSIFAPLYVLVIFAAALLLPVLGGMLVG